ncbi:MAG TPA: universal stress protein [Acidisarcina sp.]
MAVIYDESHEAERALRAAISLAGTLSSHLHIVTVIKPAPVYTVYADAVDPQVARVIEGDHLTFYAQLQARAATVAQAAELSVTKHLLQGVEVESIIDLLKAERVDLLVLGLHRETSTIARLWNRVFELAENAPCSLLGIH